MRVVIQRVSRATVKVGGESVATVGPGLLILVGVGSDTGRPFGGLVRVPLAAIWMRCAAEGGRLSQVARRAVDR